MQINFDTTNASFCNPFFGDPDKLYFRKECQRIFDSIIYETMAGKESGIIRDNNGNRIGEWKL